MILELSLNEGSLGAVGVDEWSPDCLCSMAYNHVCVSQLVAKMESSPVGLGS